MSTPRSLFTGLLLLALASPTVLSAQADYEIRFGRNAKVGDRFRMVSQGVDEQTTTMQFNGKDMPPRHDGYEFELVADCEVLAVTENGREKKAQITIGKLSRTLSGQAGEILPAGTVVTAEKIDGKMRYTAGGSPVVPMVAKILDIAGVVMAGEGEAGNDDDNILGSGKRRQVGETWTINSEAAARSLGKRGIQADAPHIQGSAQLVEITQERGEPVQRIAAQFKVSDVKPPLPAGVEVDTCELSSSHAGLFPVDVTKGRLQDSMAIALSVTAHGNKDGNSINLTMSKKTSRDTKFIRN